MAEDHGLCDSNGSIDVAQGLELLLLAVADDIILLDGVQSLLFTLKFNNVGVRNDPLCKVPHSFFKRGREQEHLASFRKHPIKNKVVILNAIQKTLIN